MWPSLHILNHEYISIKMPHIFAYSKEKHVGPKRGCSRWVEGRRFGERLLPLLLRLIKTAPTFLLNHPASPRTKHFYQCLFLGKQWQVGCQGPPWPCFRCTIAGVRKWCKKSTHHHMETNTGRDAYRVIKNTCTSAHTHIVQMRLRVI